MTDLAGQQVGRKDWDIHCGVSAYNLDRSGVLYTEVDVYGFDPNRKNGDRIPKTVYHDLLERASVEQGRGLEPGWGAEVEVVELRSERKVGGSADDERREVLVSVRRGIGSRLGRGRRGRLRSRDVYRSVSVNMKG
jgi:hypothetical protein